MARATLLGQYLADSGITQQEFATAAGLSKVLVSTWVHGFRKPGLRHALAVEKATAGKVPASYWVEFRTRRRRKQRCAS